MKSLFPHYAYSLDGESYFGSHRLREDALREGHVECQNYHDRPGPVWTAVRIEPDLGKIARSMLDFDEDILTALNTAADEDFGEYVGDWPDATPGARDRLNCVIAEAVENWLRAEITLDGKLTPGFFSIDPATVEQHD